VSDAPAHPAEAAAATVRDRLAALAAELRVRGVRVGTGEVELAVRALAAVDASRRDEARLALRAVLCSRREDVAAFDEAFAAAFGRAGTAAAVALPPALEAALPQAPEGAAPLPSARPLSRAHPEEAELVVRPAAWSDVELLRDRDLAELSAAELVAAHALMRRLARVAPTRRSRRMRRARSHGRRLDLHGTVRASLRHGGEPLERRWRAPARAPRPLVLVVDVSGSMAPYAQMLLRYAQAAVNAQPRVEVFALGTRLTRVTPELRTKDVDRGLERATRATRGFGGGTRIGAGVGDLNRGQGRRLGRGAIVVVLSDGWDRGDPRELSDELARLRRTAHRLVWLNPLKARPGYEPLARGMAAALPHVDEFLEGHSVRSLESLADLLEGPLSR
jgi:uncharacterized protein with von Willebrand factor type A (vWA) domain